MTYNLYKVLSDYVEDIYVVAPSLKEVIEAYPDAREIILRATTKDNMTYPHLKILL